MYACAYTSSKNTHTTHILPQIYIISQEIYLPTAQYVNSDLCFGGHFLTVSSAHILNKSHQIFKRCCDCVSSQHVVVVCSSALINYKTLLFED